MPLLLTEEAPLLVFQSLLRFLLRTRTNQAKGRKAKRRMAAPPASKLLLMEWIFFIATANMGRHYFELHQWRKQANRQVKERETWEWTLLGERSQIAPRKTNGRRKKRRNTISQQK